MNPPQDNLKRRLMSRMKNYTNNQRILKRYKNDLNLLENVTKSETLKKVSDMLYDELLIKDNVLRIRLQEKLKELETK